MHVRDGHNEGALEDYHVDFPGLKETFSPSAVIRISRWLSNPQVFLRTWALSNLLEAVSQVSDVLLADLVRQIVLIDRVIQIPSDLYFLRNFSLFLT
jgi:hypothetical protein